MITKQEEFLIEEYNLDVDVEWCQIDSPNGFIYRWETEYDFHRLLQKAVEDLNE